MPLSPEQTTTVEDALRLLDPDEGTWPTGEQVETIAEALLSTSSDLHELVAAILEDREAETAAAYVRDPDKEQEIFDTYFGPMLDEIETDLSGHECSCSNPEAATMTGHGHSCDLYFKR